MISIRYWGALAIVLTVCGASPLLGQSGKGSLLPGGTVSNQLVNYAPYFSSNYLLYTSHYNVNDPVPEGFTIGAGADAKFLVSLYIVGRNENFLSASPNFTSIMDSVSKSLFFRLAKPVMDQFATTGPSEDWNSLGYSFMYSRVFGYLFIPGEAEFLARSKQAGGLLDPVGKTSVQVIDYITEVENAGEANFRAWYNATSFSDYYGLVTKALAPRANALRDYTLQVLTSPAPFSPAKFNALSGGIVDAGSGKLWTDEKIFPFSGLTNATDNGTTYTAGEITLGSRVKNYDALVQSGVLQNVWEADLFNMWVTSEFLLTDTYVLLDFARSGQSALSIPQLVVDTQLPATVVKASVFSGRPAKAGGPSGGSEALTVVDNASQSPLADLSYSWISVYGRDAGLAKTSGSYSFTFPRGAFSLGAYYNTFYSLFPYLGRNYLSIDTFLKGVWTPWKASDLSTNFFSTAGVTLNDGTLWANYINTSVGGYQEATLGDWFFSGGAILSTKYWSQFPQAEVKTTLAARAGYNILGAVSINLDSLYVRTWGALYEGHWFGYEGKNLNYLLEGLTVDVHVGDAFNLTLGLKKDFLMENFTSLEATLGGSFVF